ncbi:MAG: hypothetical protein V4690_03230 [Patescibacteria group bacterium]
MSEGFKLDIEEVGEGEEPVSGVEFEEYPDPTPEQIKTGILQRLASFAGKHSRTINLVSALALVIEVGVAKEKVVDPYIEDLDLPEVHVPEIGNDPSPSKEEVLRRIEEETGVYFRIRDVNSIATPEERPERIDSMGEIAIEGFEDFEISNETVREILEKTMPQGFLRNIRSIKYKDVDLPMPSVYGRNLATSSKQAGNASDYRKSITILKGAKESSKHWIVHHLIPHEVFHLQDADSNFLLTVDERIELYEKLIERVRSTDRFKSGYVEKVDNEDKKTELRVKVSEYFAEIGSVYLSPDYHLLPEADKEIIRSLIEKIDPDFDRVEALNIRRGLIGEIVPKVIEVKSLEELIVEAKSQVRSLAETVEEIRRAFEIAKSPVPSEDILMEEAKIWHKDDMERAIRNAKARHQQLLKDNENAKKIYRGEK